ncbi:MAG TPA: hypothetical protein VEP90_23350 [Methylomirabilota bacterium]|nr:hypothetical protein [Methylomirabilota bacterium]
MMQTQTTAVFSEELAVLPTKLPTSSTVYNFPINRQKIFITEPNRDWRPAIMERLEKLTRLETGWDGYLGEPVSFANANFALRMLEGICSKDTPAPQIVPGTRGDLQIEWHTHITDIELHVIAPNNVHAWLADEKTGPDGKDFLLTINFTEVARQIRKMTEHASDRVATS